MTTALDAAKSVLEVAAKSSKPVLTAWLGGASILEARAAFEVAGVPNFMTPENAVDAFSHLARFQPAPTHVARSASRPCGDGAKDTAAAIATAVAIRDQARREDRHLLNEMESKRLLSAFGLNADPGTLAKTRDEALSVARKTGYPVAMKIVAPGLTHKTDVGGVRTNLQNARRSGQCVRRHHGTRGRCQTGGQGHRRQHPADGEICASTRSAGGHSARPGVRPRHCVWCRWRGCGGTQRCGAGAAALECAVDSIASGGHAHRARCSVPIAMCRRSISQPGGRTHPRFHHRCTLAVDRRDGHQLGGASRRRGGARCAHRE